jgi:hypothetical protein
MPTREEYIDALNRAAEAKDYAAANEIADLLDKMDPEAAAPPPETEEETYLQGVQQRYRETDFAGIASEFGPELERRLSLKAVPDAPGMPGTGGVTKFDVATTTASQAARTGGAMPIEAFTPLIPNVVREAAGSAWELLSASPYGQAAMLAASSGLDVYQEWAKNNPQEAEAFETTVDVTALFSPRPDLLQLDKKSLWLKKSGLSDKQAKERQAVTNMLEPESLPTRAETEKVGFLGTEQWVPDAFLDSVIDRVLMIPGVKPYGSVHHNMRVVQQHVKRQAEKLTKIIKTQNKKIEMDDVVGEYVATLDDFKSSDVFKLASDAAQKQFIKFTHTALEILQEEGVKGLDLNAVFRARKRFDEALKDSNSEKILEADVATYQAQAAKLVRGVLNDVLKRNTKGDAVHDLLDDQFRSITSLDYLAPKRNREGKNAVSRALQTVKDNTGITLSTTALSIIAAGSAFVSAPVAIGAAAAAGGVALSKAIARFGKPAVIKAYAELLSATNKTIKTINDPLRREVLELDRVVLTDILETVRSYEEDE